MKHAIIYSRVSSQQQVRDGHGIEGQESRCRSFAVSRGYEVVNVFRDEGVSGGLIDRPGMQKLLAYLEKQQGKDATVVIIDDIKRLARDIEGHFSLRTSIYSRNGFIESPSMRFDETPEGKFVETVLAGAAELERNQNKKQVVNRMKARLEAGYWTFDHPPGYRYEKVAGHGKLLVPDAAKADMIKEALEGFAVGRFQTLEDVRHFLASKSFTHRGKSGLVYTEQVKRILNRVLYTGYIAYAPWSVPLRQGHHQALISMDTFVRIQERLKEGERSPQRKDIHKDFPLRGFVLCSECQQPLTAGWTQGRNQKYPYYRCKTKSCAQRNHNIKKKEIEEKFEKLLMDVKPRQNILEVVRIELLALWKKKIFDVEAILKRLSERKQQVAKDIAVYCERVKEARSPMVIKTYEDKIEELEMEQLRLGENDKKQPAQNLDFETALHRVFEFIKDPLLMWKTGDLAQQRLVLRMIFEKPLVYDAKLGVYTATLSLPVKVSTIPELDRMLLVEMPGVEPGSNVYAEGLYDHVVLSSSTQ